jgi:hypothetical protein
MRQAVLENSELAHVKDRFNDSTARKLVDAVIALDDDDVGEQLSDCNPPLPCLLALFAEGDSIEACFNEEADGMLEVTPEPNLIIPFDPTDRRDVRDAFHVFGVACQTIAAASRVIDLMPGNDQWIISPRIPADRGRAGLSWWR